MKKALIALAVLLSCALCLLVLAGWWLLKSDSVEEPNLPGAVEVGSMLHQGQRRTWRTYVPSTKTEKSALLLLLHGSRGDGERMRSKTTFYKFDELAEREGFLVVYPDGYEQHWNDCRATASYTANLENIDDVSFLDSLVKLLSADHGVDTSRVYVAGMSNGGHMAYRLGFEAPDLVAGIAAIAANIPVDEHMDCERSGNAVSVMIMNGTEDPINPYHGGTVELFGDTSRGDVMSSAATAGYWSKTAGYKEEGAQYSWPQRTPADGTTVESTEWSNPGQKAIALVSILGGGHTVPNLEYDLPRIIGTTSHQLSGAEVIWSFFTGRDLVAP
jgi:polyhydroxybutyrate depolymerase